MVMMVMIKPSDQQIELLLRAALRTHLGAGDLTVDPDDVAGSRVNLSTGNKNIIVDFAMRYGNPSIKSKIHKLHEMGCEKG